MPKNPGGIPQKGAGGVLSSPWFVWDFQRGQISQKWHKGVFTASAHSHYARKSEYATQNMEVLEDDFPGHPKGGWLSFRGHKPNPD